MDELYDLIAAKLDVMEFLDILGMELPDILEKFEDEIREYNADLWKAVQ